MKVSYGKGLATHTGPKSCVGVPTRWRTSEGHTRGAAMARRQGTPRGQRPGACTQAPCARTGRSHERLLLMRWQTASGSRKTHDDDERSWEVGQAHSTDEAAEQSRGTGCGGGGGKGPGQGKPARGRRVPDTGPGRRAQRARTGTSGAKGVLASSPQGGA